MELEICTIHGVRTGLSEYNPSQKFHYERTQSPDMPEKGGGAGAGQVMRFLFTIFVLLIFMVGSLIGLYLYMEYLVRLSEREGFTEEDLLAPSMEVRSLESEKPPVYILPWEPGLSPEIRLIIALNIL